MAGKPPEVDYTLENLLDYDGRIQWLDCGWWLKFEVQRVGVTEGIPHGVKYSLTLHDEDGTRMMGYDNAHAIGVKKGVKTTYLPRWEHWHRDALDTGRPYSYVDGAKLIQDFFEAAERTLQEHGHRFVMISDEEAP